MVEVVDYEDGRAIIATLGGLASTSELARRWGLSRERVRQFTQMDGFPEPAGEAAPGWNIYFAEEADDWRLVQAGYLRADGALTPIK